MRRGRRPSAVVLLACLAVACSSQPLQLAVFPNPLPPIEEDDQPMMPADETAGWIQLGLSLAPSDALLRISMFRLPIPDGELERALRRHGYLTLNQMLPRADELLSGARELAQHGDTELSPSDIPIVLPQEEFTFADNMMALRFAAGSDGRALLQKQTFDVDAAFASDEAAIAHSEEVAGRPFSVARARIAVVKAFITGVPDAPEWETSIAQIRRDRGGTTLLWQVFLLRALLRLRSGDDRRAADDLTAAVSQIETLRTSTHVPDLRRTQFADKLLAYELLIGCLVRQGRTTEAERVSQLAKARSFQDVLPPRSPASRPEVLERRRALARRVLSLSAHLPDVELAKREWDFEAISAFVEQTSRATIEYQRLRRDLQEVADESRAPSHEPIIAAPARWIAIDYFVATDHLYVWTIGPHGVVGFHDTPMHAEDLVAAVRDLHKRIAAGDDYEDQARALYGVLIAPAAPLLTERNVLVIPHHILHFLPFDALMHEGRFLAETHTLASAPSLGAPRNRGAARPLESFFGVGNPDGTLAKAATEVQIARQEFTRGEVLVGADGTRQAVLRDAAPFDVVHFATHVDVSPYPLLTRVRLADDDLYLFEIPELRTAARLVVLSACRSNIGTVESGDELTALGRAFLEAGVPDVVVTLWPIQDQSTSEFMTFFYEGLSDNGDAAASLVEAKRRMIREGYELSPTGEPIDLKHPHYWSGFVLVRTP